MRNLLITREDIKPYPGICECEILLIALRSHLAEFKKEAMYKFQDRYIVRRNSCRQQFIVSRLFFFFNVMEFIGLCNREVQGQSWLQLLWLGRCFLGSLSLPPTSSGPAPPPLDSLLFFCWFCSQTGSVHGHPQGDSSINFSQHPDI